MTEHEASLEARIQGTYLQMLEAVTATDRGAACTAMTRLIAQRSLDQVRRMELARGLVHHEDDRSTGYGSRRAA